MHELVRVVAVARERGDAHRDGGADRLARGLDLEEARRDRAADPVGDLERLLRRRLRQEDRELLAAEARRHVVVAQLLAEDLGDAAQDGVAGEVAVGVVDVAQQVEVGHDQRHRPLEALGAPELLLHHRREVPGVVEAGLRVDSRLGLQLRDRERAVDQEQRRDRERDQPRVQVPERGDREAERREDEVGREALEREDARPRAASGRGRGVTIGARTMWFAPTATTQAARPASAQRRSSSGIEAVRAQEQRGRPPRRQVPERVVADVEALDVPGVPLLQPLGHVHDDAEQRDELRRQQHRARDQEDPGGVERRVAGRAHGVGVRCGRAGREDQERRPLRRLRVVEARQERQRGGESRRSRSRRRTRPRLVGSARRRCSGSLASLSSRTSLGIALIRRSPSALERGPQCTGSPLKLRLRW